MQAYSYDAFGKLVSWNPWGPSTPLRYTGQYQDNETGYIYLRNRYYDPTTAQFTSRDPINAITRSSYAYVNNSPLNGSDPSGLAVWGQCHQLSSSAFGALGTGKCMVTDGVRVSVVTYIAVGYGGLMGAGGGQTYVYSTAGRISNFLGKSDCWGGGAGNVYGGQGDVCFNSDGSMTYSAGAEFTLGLIPAEAHHTDCWASEDNSFQIPFRDYPESESPTPTSIQIGAAPATSVLIGAPPSSTMIGGGVAVPRFPF